MAVFDSSIFSNSANRRINSNNNLFDMLSGAVSDYQDRKIYKEAKLEEQKQEALDPDYVMGLAASKGINSLNDEQKRVFAGQNLKYQSQVVYDPVTKAPVSARRDMYGLLPGVESPTQQSTPTTPSNFDSLMTITGQVPMQAGNSVIDDKKSTADLSGIKMNPVLEQRAKEEELKLRYSDVERKKKSLDPKEYSGEQAKAAAFANRMRESTRVIEETLPENAGKAKTGPAGYLESFLAAIPSAGITDQLGKGIVKMSSNPEEQQYLNAAQNWIRANLRKESGAVIGEQEMKDEYATYFPTPGDSKEVIERKRQARLETEKGMIAQTGGAFSVLFPESGSVSPKSSSNSNPQRKRFNPKTGRLE